MKISILLILLGASNAIAEEQYQFRQWTGSNGKQVIAKYKSSHGTTVTFTDGRNHSQKVELSKLSNQDRIYVRAITRNQNIKFTHPKATQSSRLLIPSLDQNLFGSTQTNGGAVAAANFFLWWDQSGVLPLPYQEKNLEKLADNIHRDIKNVMHTGEPNSEKFHHGLVEYIKKKALHQYYNPEFTIHKATTETLKTIPVDGTMGVLSLTTLKNGRSDAQRYVSVVALNDQIIQFNTWGYHFTGTLRPGVFDKRKGLFIDLVKEPGTKAYQWINKQGGGFFIDEKSDFIVAMSLTKRDSPRRIQTGIKQGKTSR